MKHLLFCLCLVLVGCQNSAVNGQPSTPEPVNSVTGQPTEVPDAALTNQQNDDAMPSSPQVPAEETPQTAENTASAELAELELPPEAAAPTDNTAATDSQNTDKKSSWPPFLTEEQRKIIQSIKWDEKPEVLYAVEEVNLGQHYLISDEKHHELYRETIENLGGTYMGVGTNQGYLYIGWQRPEFGILFDYDPMVVELHQILLAFIQVCDTSECLSNYIKDEKAGLEWLQGEGGTAAGLNNKHMIGRYKKLRKTLIKAFVRMKDMSEKTMMNDVETYEYIHHLAVGGRLVTVRANLLGKASMKSIADGLNKLNAKVTTLYLSNAEQYWDYTPEFKENMLALPIADNGFVMRTSASYPQNGDYRYSVQPLPVFRAWMERKRCKKVAQMLKKVRIRAEEFPFVVDDKMPAPLKQ
ncbi:MAG: hypothetical protein IJU23_13040 [Proteobacteria bacterium]|nr:hypothetical protein [Pseudomonadota bacterium]